MFRIVKPKGFERTSPLAGLRTFVCLKDEKAEVLELCVEPEAQPLRWLSTWYQ